MIFSLAIIVIFVAVSIYFYFRAENLYRQLMLVKKEAAGAKKESKHLTDNIALLAKKQQDSAQHRIKRIKELVKDEQDVEILQPLINNYSAILLESIRGKGQMQKMAQKCCESYGKGHFKQLTNHIAKQEQHVKRFWSANNQNGFISFIEAMLLELESKLIPSSNKE